MDFSLLAITSAVIVAAMIVFVYFVRARPRRAGLTTPNRVQVIEYVEVDNQRRLVLVRRDLTEHLLLIGGPQDLVVETNVSAAEIFLAPRQQPLEETDLSPAYATQPKPRPKTSAVHAFAPRAPNLRKASEREEPKLSSAPSGPGPSGNEPPTAGG